MRTIRCQLKAAGLAVGLFLWNGGGGNTTNAQDPLWMIGSSQVHFPQEPATNVSTSPLPQSFDPSFPDRYQYQGQVAEHTQNIQYDDEGNVLFFVVDGNIYNRDGLLIADGAEDIDDRDCEVCFLGGVQVHIIPVPGSCTRYYVLGLFFNDFNRDAAAAEESAMVRWGVLDMGLRTDLPIYEDACTPVNGRFLDATELTQTPVYGAASASSWGNGWEVITPVNAPDQAFYYLQQGVLYSGPGGGQVGPAGPLHGASLQLEPGGRTAMVVRCDQGLVILDITATDIWKVPSPFLSAGYWPFVVPGPFDPDPNVIVPDIYNIIDNDRSQRADMALHYMNGALQVAWSSYSWYEVTPGERFSRTRVSRWQFQLAPGTPFAVQPNIPFLPSGGANPTTYFLDNYADVDPPLDYFGNPILRPALPGVEFSPNGRYLYFIKSPNFALPTGGVESNFGYIDQQWEFGDPGDQITLIPIGTGDESTKLVDSQLDINVGPDGTGTALYALSADVDQQWLSVFRDPDNPTTGTWEMEYLSLPDVASFTEDNSPATQFRFLNRRLYRSTNLLAQQNSGCCEDLALTRDRSTTITPGCQTIWSPGNNPFYNTLAPIDVVTELRIAAGVSVSATDMEFRFAPDAVLVIEPGATFISNNCTFTASCGGQWKGIRVEGTTSNWQQQSGSQGRLFLEPGSVVEHAEIGAWTAREISSGAPDPLRFGGIVRSNGATFMDCTTGIRIERFHRTVPFLGIELNNLSSVSNTGFLTTENWMGQGNPYAHVYLYDVNGISITNSRFANEAFELFGHYDRGWGIVGLDAAFTCSGSIGSGHYFNNLTVGVIGSTPNALERYVVNGMAFTDNIMGVADLGSTGARITRNIFQLLDDENELSYGIQLFSSEFYTIERNHFTRTLGTGYNCVGISFMGTAIGGNQVYDNVYDKVTVGNWVQGQLRNPNLPMVIAPGLQMRCGTHVDNFITHLYTDEAVVQMQQGLPFGGPQNLANNEHLSTPVCDPSDITVPSFHPYVVAFQNYSLFVNYNFYGHPSSPEQRPSCVEDEFGVPEAIGGVGDWFYDLVRVNQTQPFDKNLHCSSGVLDIEENFQGLMAGSLSSDYQQTVAALGSAVNTYQGTVDQGQKVDLLEALRQQPTLPSHELRDVLLAHHPLSDEVLKETIFRAEPLDPWHLTQVLIANSRLNGWVLQAVEEAEILPDYFRYLVKQAQSGEVGVKYLLELEILQRQNEKDFLLRRLVDAWASDTLHAQKEDSVLALLHADVTGYGTQGAYMQHVLQGNAAAASSLAQALNSSPWNGDLVEYGAMLSLAGGEWIGLKGSETTLRRMAFEHSPGSGALAWATLLAMQELDSVPMPQLPGMMKSVVPQRPQRHLENETPVIGVLPNPASDRIAFTTPLHDVFEHGVLEIFDAQGHLVNTLPLNGRRGLIESTVAAWPPGLYIVRLMVAGKPIGSTKFTVAR
ncbi:MAG: T9SS type A sorting domain-containing protein [Flavobacteriales bacterium]